MSSKSPGQASVRSEGGVDPSWNGIFRTGAISAFGYVVLGIVAPALLYFPVGYPRTSDGETLLNFIADHRAWWIALQTLTLGPGFLAILVFAAVFVALSQVEKGYAAIGSLLAIACQLLFVSFYPGTLGMLFLSDQYAAADPERQQDLIAAAEAVTAPLDAYNPLYETVFATGVLIISLVMLRGVFSKWTAYLGIAAAASELIGVSFLSLIGMGYFWWWLVFAAWFVMVGTGLWRMRSATPAGTHSPPQRRAGSSAVATRGPNPWTRPAVKPAPFVHGSNSKRWPFPEPVQSGRKAGPKCPSEARPLAGNFCCMRNDSPEPDTEVLSATACWDLLRGVSVGHLAVLVDGHPEIFPVNYKVDHESLVFRTGEGTKLYAAGGAAPVALEADGTDQERRIAWSVHVKGRALELEPSPDLMTGVGLTLFPWQAGQKNHFVRIVPTSVTGRRFVVTTPLTWWSHLDDSTRTGFA